MITRDYENSIQKLRGLSTDTKPADVPNGAELLEMDTGTLYRFNAVNNQWVEQAESGGGARAVVVTYTMDSGGTITSDMTYDEIRVLIDSGAIVTAKLQTDYITYRGHLMSSDSSTGMYFAFCDYISDVERGTIVGLRHGLDRTASIFPYIVSPTARLEVNFTHSGGGDYVCDQAYVAIYSALMNNVPIQASIVNGSEITVTTSVSANGSTGNISFFAFETDSNGNVSGKCITITTSNAVYYGSGDLSTGSIV